MERTPQFEHPCKECQFIGRYTYKLGNMVEEYDLYYDQADSVLEEGSLIARYSDDISDELGAPPFVAARYPLDHPLNMALRRAQELGLLKQQEQRQP